MFFTNELIELMKKLWKNFSRVGLRTRADSVAGRDANQ